MRRERRDLCCCICYEHEASQLATKAHLMHRTLLIEHSRHSECHNGKLGSLTAPSPTERSSAIKLESIQAYVCALWP